MHLLNLNYSLLYSFKVARKALLVPILLFAGCTALSNFLFMTDKFQNMPVGFAMTSGVIIPFIFAPLLVFLLGYGIAVTGSVAADATSSIAPDWRRKAIAKNLKNGLRLLSTLCAFALLLNLIFVPLVNNNFYFGAPDDVKLQVDQYRKRQLATTSEYEARMSEIVAIFKAKNGHEPNQAMLQRIHRLVRSEFAAKGKSISNTSLESFSVKRFESSLTEPMRQFVAITGGMVQAFPNAADFVLSIGRKGLGGGLIQTPSAKSGQEFYEICKAGVDFEYARNYVGKSYFGNVVLNYGWFELGFGYLAGLLLTPLFVGLTICLATQEKIDFNLVKVWQKGLNCARQSKLFFYFLIPTYLMFLGYALYAGCCPYMFAFIPAFVTYTIVIFHSIGQLTINSQRPALASIVPENEPELQISGAVGRMLSRSDR